METSDLYIDIVSVYNESQPISLCDKTTFQAKENEQRTTNRGTSRSLWNIAAERQINNPQQKKRSWKYIQIEQIWLHVHLNSKVGIGDTVLVSDQYQVSRYHTSHHEAVGCLNGGVWPEEDEDVLPFPTRPPVAPPETTAPASGGWWSPTQRHVAAGRRSHGLGEQQASFPCSRLADTPRRRRRQLCLLRQAAHWELGR